MQENEEKLSIRLLDSRTQQKDILKQSKSRIKRQRDVQRDKVDGELPQ
jgi:hypothetical protein